DFAWFLYGNDKAQIKIAGTAAGLIKWHSGCSVARQRCPGCILCLPCWARRIAAGQPPARVRTQRRFSMAKPAISVAMSVYNEERFVHEAIDSVLAQTFADFEFLILDDGSSDATPAIIREYTAHDSRIRPIIRGNRGRIASLNQLLAEARAPIVARMDGDDICHPERFSKQMAFLEAHPDYGVVGSWSEDIDEHGRTLEMKGSGHPLDHQAFLQAIGTGGQLICHPAAMFRRDIVLSVGGYHAAFRHCEDFDLWLRLASVTRLGNLPERLIRYRHSAGQVSSRHATEQQIGAAISLAAYKERSAGRLDPTASLARLPPIPALDALLGRDGAAREVRAQVAR